jgi:hypothetical protein
MTLEALDRTEFTPSGSSAARVVASARRAGAHRWTTLGSVSAKAGANRIKLAARTRRRLGRQGFVVVRLRAVRPDGLAVHSDARVRLG